MAIQPPKINLDPDLARRLNDGMTSGETLDLPFPVIYVWAMNGQPSYKSQGGALYYGGWACKADDLDALKESGAGISDPAGWKRTTSASREGDEFEIYGTRHVIVAPIGKRQSWLLDGRRHGEYIDGARRHVQALCYMAERIEEGKIVHYLPWGPVVLTAKGYQARHLLDAFTKWDKATAGLRRQIAPGVPAWCFYLALGTFGKERAAVNVGKPGAQSPITPITAWIPDGINETILAQLFVGQAVAEKMADLQDQASEWLAAWQPGALEQSSESEVYGNGQPPAPDNWGSGDEDIPF